MDPVFDYVAEGGVLAAADRRAAAFRHLVETGRFVTTCYAPSGAVHLSFEVPPNNLLVRAIARRHRGVTVEAFTAILTVVVDLAAAVRPEVLHGLSRAGYELTVDVVSKPARISVAGPGAGPGALQVSEPVPLLDIEGHPIEPGAPDRSRWAEFRVAGCTVWI